MTCSRLLVSQPIQTSLFAIKPDIDQTPAHIKVPVRAFRKVQDNGVKARPAWQQASARVNGSGWSHGYRRAGPALVVAAARRMGEDQLQGPAPSSYTTTTTTTTMRLETLRKPRREVPGAIVGAPSSGSKLTLGLGRYPVQ